MVHLAKFSFSFFLDFCGGASSGNDRACSGRSFGYQYQPLNVLEEDATTQNRGLIAGAVGDGTFTDSNYLGKFSGPASYLAFVGTVVVGASFLGEWSLDTQQD